MIAEALVAQMAYILQENEKDMTIGKENGLSPSLLDRLQLTEERIQQIADGVRQVIDLPDPIGETIEQWTRPNGLLLKQIRVPLGVVGMVYEARPNVTVDAASLCLKQEMLSCCAAVLLPFTPIKRLFPLCNKH